MTKPILIFLLLTSLSLNKSLPDSSSLRENPYTQCVAELERSFLDGFEIAKAVLEDDYSQLPQLAWDCALNLGLSIYCFVVPPKYPAIKQCVSDFLQLQPTGSAQTQSRNRLLEVVSLAKRCLI